LSHNIDVLEIFIELILKLWREFFGFDRFDLFSENLV
jgi:hypothetical protein